jgi:tRNA (guanine-N7-)-methyltransferase
MACCQLARFVAEFGFRLAPCKLMVPGYDFRIIYELPSIIDRLDLARLFSSSQPLEVELGSGDGSFLVNRAKVVPSRNFIGVERLLGRLRKMERKAKRAGLANLRAVRIESSYFLQHLLPLQSLTALHIYFPDPWPKRKHWRHRLINPTFPSSAARALVSGGTVFLRTDDAAYFSQMREVFSASTEFKSVEAPPELSELLTDFEREFHAQGTPTLRAAYQKAS